MTAIALRSPCAQLLVNWINNVPTSTCLTDAPCSPQEASRGVDCIRFSIRADLTVLGVDRGTCSPTRGDEPFDISPGNRLRLKGADARARLIKAMSLLQERPSSPCAFVPLDDGERNRSRYLIVRHLSGQEGIEIPDPFRAERPLFVVTYRDLRQEVPMAPETLEDSLGLTPMEARLCIALLNEQTLQDFAQDCGLTIATARWHWGNVREKLNVRTQLGLVRMLMRLAMP